MRQYYAVSGILLILLTIDFAFAAPVLLQEKPRARVDVVHITDDAITMLGKRGGELGEFWINVFGHPESPPDPDLLRDLLAAHPPGPADGSIDVGQQLPPIPEEPSRVSSPGHAPLSPSDELNKVWHDLSGHGFFEKSSAARPLLGSPPSGSAPEWMDTEKLLPSIHEEPSPVSNTDHAPPSPGDESNKLWRNFFMGLPETHFLLKPEEFPAVHPSSSSSGHALLSPDDELNKVWFDLFGHRFFEESSAGRPSWASPSFGTAHGSDAEQLSPSIPEDTSPVSSPDHAPPSPGSSTEFGHELVNWDVPRWP